jgi:DNA-binding CsgD family transcriptional regulator
LIEFLWLDETAATVYRALLAAAGSPADISLATGLPEPVILAALGALAGMRLVRGPADPASDEWHPLRPDLGLATMARQYEADLARMSHQLAVLQTAATAAAAASAAATLWSVRLRHTAAPVEPLETCQDALAEAYLLAKHASKEYLQVMPLRPEQLEVLHSGLYLHEAAVARGVSLKVLYHDSTSRDPAALAHARRTSMVGAEVRVAQVLPPPLVICDGQVALIPGAEDQPQTALRIREPAIVAVLQAVFDNSWDIATPLATSIIDHQPTELTQAEQALLRLLAAGFTDEAAASKLDKSLSTISRQKKALMRRLQATSPFQAGLNAARSGWL